MAAWLYFLVFLVFEGISALYCNSNYFTWDGDDLCYAALAGPYTYADSSKYCTIIGGEVASLYSEEQFYNSSKFMQSGKQYYVNTVKVGNIFNWQDGTSINKKFWIADEPKPANGNCVVYDNSVYPVGLRVFNCGNLGGALCFERPSGDCPSSYTGYRRTITSVNYPNHYYNDINCTTTLSASVSNGTVNIVFTDFQVESPWDYVSLFEGSGTGGRLIKQITKENVNKTASSTSNAMTLLFTTDSTNTDKGWSADVYSGNSTTPQRYGGYSGNFTSPNYPDNYANNEAQFYYFFYSSNYKYTFTFTHFQLENNDDFLYIYEGLNPPRKVQSYTGLNMLVPFNYTANDSNVMMVFSTDGSVVYSGFSANYQAH